MAADEILTVHVVSKDGGDYICRCPHCGEIVTTDATELDEVRGLQYKHEVRTRFGITGCGSWLEIAEDARRVRELPERNAGVVGTPAPSDAELLDFFCEGHFQFNDAGVVDFARALLARYARGVGGRDGS